MLSTIVKVGIILSLNSSAPINYIRAFQRQRPLLQRADYCPHRYRSSQVQEQILGPRLAHLLTADGHVEKALFAPTDPVKSTLIDLIDFEQQKIRIAMYFFTDMAIAEACLHAKERNIPVEVVLDPTTTKGHFEKIPRLLHEHNIDLFVYRAKQPGRDKMHNKFVLFDKNLKGKPLLCNGSYNLTNLASKANQENIIVLNSKTLFQAFQNKFEELKRLSDHYMPKL